MIGIGVVQFSAAMVAVQAFYPGYSDTANYISDLGNTATSPWHVVFNLSIIALGLLAFAGILLTWSEFPPGGSRVVGLFLLLAASVGAIGVGLFPENVNPTVHGIASLAVFAPGGAAIVTLGSGMRAGSDWHWLRLPSVILGVITLVSIAYYVPTQGTNVTWDPGLVERFIVFPILLWGFLAAAELAVRPHRTLPRAGAAT